MSRGPTPPSYVHYIHRRESVHGAGPSGSGRRNVSSRLGFPSQSSPLTLGRGAGWKQEKKTVLSYCVPFLRLLEYAHPQGLELSEVVRPQGFILEEQSVS